MPEDNPTRHLLRLVAENAISSNECSAEFVDTLRGIIAFDLEDEYPLLENITQDDMIKRRILDRDNWAYDTYRVTFTNHFREQVFKHYPEELL